MTVPLVSCHGVVNGRLTQLRPAGNAAGPLARLLHGQVQGVLSAGTCSRLPAPEDLQCLGYRLGIYPGLATRAAIDECAVDLAEGMQIPFLMAIFDGPLGADEDIFDKRADEQIEGVLNRLPGRRFQILKMHPGATRWCHRFSWPALFFNVKNPPFDARSAEHESCQCP